MAFGVFGGLSTVRPGDFELFKLVCRSQGEIDWTASVEFTFEANSKVVVCFDVKKKRHSCSRVKVRFPFGSEYRPDVSLLQLSLPQLGRANLAGARHTGFTVRRGCSTTHGIW